MDKIITEQKYYLSEGIFYKITDEGLMPINKIEGKNYTLIISDEYFFYDEIKIENLPQKNRKEILKNQLLLKYPEEFIQNFYFIYENDTVFFLIPNKVFFDILAQHKDYFKHAKKITTDYLIKNDISQSLQMTATANDELKKIIPATIILAISLLVFIFAKNIEVKRYSKIHNDLNSKINSLYKKAGVLNTNDPYGMLLYKAQKKNFGQKNNIMEKIAKISSAIKKQAVIDELEIKTNYTILQGSTKDFATLDKIKNELSKKFSKNINVLNTSKKDDKVIFTIRLET